MRLPLVVGVFGCLFLPGCVGINYRTPDIVDVNTVIEFLFRFSHYQDRCLRERGYYDESGFPQWADPAVVSGYEAVKRRDYSCSFRVLGKAYSASCNPGEKSSNKISLYMDETAAIRVEAGRPAGPQSGIYRGKRPPD
jgi:hypothetical protein